MLVETKARKEAASAADDALHLHEVRLQSKPTHKVRLDKCLAVFTVPIPSTQTAINVVCLLWELLEGGAPGG